MYRQVGEGHRGVGRLGILQHDVLVTLPPFSLICKRYRGSRKDFILQGRALVVAGERIWEGGVGGWVFQGLVY